MSWYSKTSSDCHNPRPLDAVRSIGWLPVRTCPSFGRSGPLTPNPLRIIPFLSCSRPELPVHSMPPHPSLLSIRIQPTQYRRTCPLPTTPKKECPCLVSSRHRSKGKRLKPDTRSREIRKRKPGIPSHRPKKRPEKMPKMYTSASLRSQHAQIVTASTAEVGYAAQRRSHIPPNTTGSHERNGSSCLAAPLPARVWPDARTVRV